MAFNNKLFRGSGKKVPARPLPPVSAILTRPVQRPRYQVTTARARDHREGR